MSEHTPSAALVRGRYCDGTYRQTGYTTDGDDFDRWLAAHDAKIAAQALRDAADDFATTLSGRRDVQGILRARADEIAGSSDE